MTVAMLMQVSELQRSSAVFCHWGRWRSAANLTVVCVSEHSAERQAVPAEGEQLNAGSDPRDVRNK